MQHGRGVDVEVAAEGVAVTLIDFTLSRLVTPDGTTAFCDLEADPELFNGPKGDCQACSPSEEASVLTPKSDLVTRTFWP